MSMKFFGIDPARPGSDRTVITVLDNHDGKPRIRKITQLYGKPGNIIFAGETARIDLVKGSDGVWR